MSSSPKTKRKPGQAERSKKARAAKAAPSRRSKSDFLVRFWGVRGSLPAPGRDTVEHGGNTPCVEVRCGDEVLIFDGGSGARLLGDAQDSPFRASIFLSHYHYDHLQGLPFFVPLFSPQNEICFYGPTRQGRTVRDVLSGQMQPPYFPVTADMVFRARVEYRQIEEGTRVQLGNATITALELHHPGGSLGYRVDFGGRSVVYATDIEHGSAADGRLAKFARGTDVLIFDAMYTDAEYQGHVGSPKIGWGHATLSAAVVAANAAEAKRLVLFHHEPRRSDAELGRLLRLVRRDRPDALSAREGSTLYI